MLIRHISYLSNAVVSVIIRMIITCYVTLLPSSATDDFLAKEPSAAMKHSYSLWNSRTEWAACRSQDTGTYLCTYTSMQDS